MNADPIIILNELRHEDDLVGQRMTWLVISQSFLFGAIVGATAQIDVPGDRGMLARGIGSAVIVVGLLLASLAFGAIVAAKVMLVRWRRALVRAAETRPALADLPNVGPHVWVLRLGDLLPLASPLLLASTWCFVGRLWLVYAWNWL